MIENNQLLNQCRPNSLLLVTVLLIYLAKAIDYEKSDNSKNFKNAEPFPHIHFDNFLSNDLA